MRKPLEEIIEKCSALKIHEKRSIKDKYYELVFYAEETDKWEKVFTDIMFV